MTLKHLVFAFCFGFVLSGCSSEKHPSIESIGNIQKEPEQNPKMIEDFSEEEKESLERLKKNRILRDLLRACHIGTCDKKNDDNKDDNNYAENYELFVMALKRCELLVLNNNNAGRIKEDVITLCKRLEKFIKLIKQKDTNNSSDKSYSAYNNSVKQKITSRKEVLDREWTRQDKNSCCISSCSRTELESNIQRLWHR